jgi:hypothetical protein
MSSYVVKVLQPGETVTFRGTIHWLIYLPALFFLLFAVAGGVLLGTAGSDSNKDVAYALMHLDCSSAYRIFCAPGLGGFRRKLPSPTAALSSNTASSGARPWK